MKASFKNLLVVIKIAILSQQLISCKPQCIDIVDETRLFNKKHESLIPYENKDTINTRDSAFTPYVYTVDTTKSYFNSFDPNTKCKGTIKLEGREFIFKGASDNIQLNIAILAEDSAQLGYYVNWKNKTFFLKSEWLQSVNAFDRIIGGTLFRKVYILTQASDSLYFNVTNGIVRIKVGNEIRMLVP